ncbi:MAG TPA: DNRLRE domain-containing protein, partial [Anaerolineales bacterium]|nr:DNRLRE domain-containing protein [Anaerolineales bacterium]
MRKLICITMAIVICVTAFAASSTVSAAPSGVDSTNLLSNGSFEEGDFSPTGSPDHWATGSASHVADFTWDETQSFDGNKSVKISADQLDDAFWGQTILVMPHTDYQLSGYIKTENVRYGVEPVQMGANLSIIGSWDDHSQPLFGSNDWTYVSFEFNSGERSQLTFAARLGFWAGTTTGTAWFDNLRLIPTSPISLQCDPSYPEGFFRACYYRGTDPYQGTLISMQEENPLGSPVPDRTFGIDHDWETGTMQNISAIWRGHLYFNAGRYQFTTFARDGVRLYIDEMRLLDQWTPDEHWYRFGTVIELTEGFHDVRVEWFTAGLMPDATLLRLHWDRVPASPEPHQVTPMVINVFLLTKQDICIVGNPWVSGERVAIYNPDGTEYRVWQREDAQDLPRTLRPSDPALNNYAQVECFSFGYLPDEIPHVLAEVDKFKGLIKNWSGGDIEPEIRLSQLEAEVNLGRIGTSWWIAPWEMAPFAASSMTTESDFAIVLSSAFDMNTRRSYEIFGCGGSYGAASYTMGGTGYSWVPCADDLIILHEWEHQFTSAVRDLLQFASIYPDIQTFPESGYPACGMADPDIFKWFPDSHDWSTDPDSPWCGMTDNVGISELHLFGHYDASLSHYPLGRFTGNHCNDGVQDFGESDIDKGSNCPAKAPQETIARQPSDDGWIQLRSSGNHGDDKQLKIGKNSRVAYLKFDLQDVRGDVTNAQLILTAPQTQEATVSLNAVADTAWQEETLTGTNAPPLGESI